VCLQVSARAVDVHSLAVKKHPDADGLYVEVSGGCGLGQLGPMRRSLAN